MPPDGIGLSLFLTLLSLQAPEADVLNLGAAPEEAEGEEEADAEELEEVIEAAKQQKRMLAERNASLQNKVHQVYKPYNWMYCLYASSSI